MSPLIAVCALIALGIAIAALAVVAMIEAAARLLQPRRPKDASQ